MPAPGQRHEAMAGDRFEHVHRVGIGAIAGIPAALRQSGGAGDVEINELVHLPLVEARHLVQRIADDLVGGECFRADQLAVHQQENRDQTRHQHEATNSSQLVSRARPALWLFSG